MSETRSEELKASDVNEREIYLVEDAYRYKCSKSYPVNATKNEKRIIRKKAEKIMIKNGEVYYRKKKGEV